MGTGFESQHRVLVQELRNSGIRSQPVLRALSAVPRHRFVAGTIAQVAYLDRALPIDCGQTISQPYVVACMTAAALGERDRLERVLEIGTGSGYQAAVLAQLAEEVYSVERIEALHLRAQTLFRELGIRNVKQRFGDGAEGWPEHAPFDAVLVTAAAEAVPPALLKQLVPGGCLVIPVAAGPGWQELQVIRPRAEGEERRRIGDVRFVPMLEGTVTGPEN